MFRDDLEKLIEHATNHKYAEELVEAKKEFQSVAGTIYEDDKSYETRMGLFLEWFTFDRILAGTELTHLERILLDPTSLETYGLRETCQGFSQNIHGLFMVRKITDTCVVVVNLFDDVKYKVLETQGKIIFRKSDLFEGRIMPHKGEFYFTGNFCFHPVEAHKFIKDEVRKVVLIQEIHKKELKRLEGELASTLKSLDKTQKSIGKLKAKIEKTQDEAKLVKLDPEKNHLEEKIRDINKSIENIRREIHRIQIAKLKIEVKTTFHHLIQRISYMQLKWERSRQIALHDIYRN